MTKSNDTSSGNNWIKWSIAALLLIIIATLAIVFREQLSLQHLANYETQLRDYQQQHPVLIIGIACLAYVVVTAMSLPGAAAMTIIYGWLFGWWALPLVSLASTSGATLAFLSARYLLRDSIEAKFGDRLQKFNEQLKREGAFYLFSLRLIPAVPFFVLNVVMGLTPIRVWTYWWVSQIGMLAGTAVYVYAGVATPSLQDVADKGVGSILNWQLITAFVLLGLFPLAVKKGMNWFRKEEVDAASV